MGVVRRAVLRTPDRLANGVEAPDRRPASSRTVSGSTVEQPPYDQPDRERGAREEEDPFHVRKRAADRHPRIRDQTRLHQEQHMHAVFNEVASARYKRNQQQEIVARRTVGKVQAARDASRQK